MDRSVRLLVIDDSPFVRTTLIRRLDGFGGIEIVGTAANGLEALEQVRRLRPDVVTMDVEMPQMNGLAALEQIMREWPTPVVMLSSLTGEGSTETLRALELGAVDFFLKPSRLAPTGTDESTANLAAKVIQASRVSRDRLGPARLPTAPVRRPPLPPARSIQRLLVIAGSTGGPKALTELLPALPGDLPAAVLVVQHIPQGFTRSMASRLDSLCAIRVKEAEEGDHLQASHAYIAPGGWHLVVNHTDTIHLKEGLPEHGICPAADVTMRSAAAMYGRRSAGVVLTGMGSDGTEGAKAIRTAGGHVAVEDESTCVVFGMPRSVIDAGQADYVVPLPGLAATIVEMCSAAAHR